MGGWQEFEVSRSLRWQHLEGRQSVTAEGGTVKASSAEVNRAVVMTALPSQDFVPYRKREAEPKRAKSARPPPCSSRPYRPRDSNGRRTGCTRRRFDR